MPWHNRSQIVRHLQSNLQCSDRPKASSALFYPYQPPQLRLTTTASITPCNNLFKKNNIKEKNIKLWNSPTNKPDPGKIQQTLWNYFLAYMKLQVLLILTETVVPFPAETAIVNWPPIFSTLSCIIFNPSPLLREVSLISKPIPLSFTSRCVCSSSQWIVTFT